MAFSMPKPFINLLIEELQTEHVQSEPYCAYLHLFSPPFPSPPPEVPAPPLSSTTVTRGRPVLQYSIQTPFSEAPVQQPVLCLLSFHNASFSDCCDNEAHEAFDVAVVFYR